METTCICKPSVQMPEQCQTIQFRWQGLLFIILHYYHQHSIENTASWNDSFILRLTYVAMKCLLFSFTTDECRGFFY